MTDVALAALHRVDVDAGTTVKIADTLGGANGSTRMMDVHFEKGMHCIDCHFLQDAHGDGNLYNTNWDTIEIECPAVGVLRNSVADEA